MRRGSFTATRLTFALLLIVLTATPAFSSGFALFEQGAKATAMGGAFAATADDPSAIFYNVAGIAYQRRMGATMGGTAINFANEFRGNAETEFPGDGVSARYEDHTFVPPNAYLVIPIGENATFGIGSFTPFGLRTDWEEGETFAGRFISQDANVKLASVQPSFAMKMANDRFAWGVGLEYRLSHITLERNTPAINPFTQQIIDVAHVRLDSDWNDTWGFNVGLMFKPTDTWNVGLSYRSASDIDYTGSAEFKQILTGNPQLDAIIGAQLPPTQDIETTINFPHFIHLGIATTRWEDWQVEFDVVHNSWSRFERLLVEFEQTPSRNLDIPENWDDSLSYRLGGNHRVTDNWDIRLGAVYDQTPQPLEGVGPLLPDADRAGVSFGVGFHGEHWSVDVTEFVLHFMDRDTEGQNSNDFNGTYETFANLFSVNVGYNF